MDEAAPSGLSVAQKGADGWPVMCSWALVACRLPWPGANREDRTGETEGKQGGWGGSFGFPLAAGGVVDGAWVLLRVGRRRVAGLFERREVE